MAEETEEVLWGKVARYNVGCEIRAVQVRRDEARDAGDHEEVLRLNEEEERLWGKLAKVANPDPKAVAAELDGADNGPASRP